MEFENMKKWIAIISTLIIISIGASYAYNSELFVERIDAIDINATSINVATLNATTINSPSLTNKLDATDQRYNDTSYVDAKISEIDLSELQNFGVGSSVINKIISYYECENNVSDYYNLNNADAFNINYVDGFLGKGCYFNGSDSTYMQINHSDSLNYYNNLTICFWHSLSLDSKGARETFVFKQSSSTTNRSFVLEHYNDGSKLNLYNFNLGTTDSSTNLQTSTANNTWNHTANSNNFVCVSWSYDKDTTMRVYIDGIESEYYTEPINKTDYMHQSITNILLGKSTTASRYIKNQYMDEIGFYYYLNSTEINKLYNDYLNDTKPIDYSDFIIDNNLVVEGTLNVKEDTYLTNLYLTGTQSYYNGLKNETFNSTCEIINYPNGMEITTCWE